MSGGHSVCRTIHQSRANVAATISMRQLQRAMLELATLRTLQDVLRHANLRTKEVDMHVTVPGRERDHEVVNQLMSDL